MKDANAYVVIEIVVINCVAEVESSEAIYCVRRQAGNRPVGHSPYDRVRIQGSYQGPMPRYSTSSMNSP